MRKAKAKRQPKARVKNVRGASSVQRKGPFAWPRLPRISARAGVLLALLASLGGIGYFGYHAMHNAAQRPIQSVSIEGEFVYVKQEEVARLLEPIIVDGFLQLPLMSVKQKLEKHPWIAQVNVSRRWPDTLLVAITEQQAIARWGNTGFLNQHGEIIAVEQTPVLASLPWLDGKDAEAKALMQHYQQFNQLLRPHGLNIATFQADATNDMTVTLSNDLMLYLGKDEVMEKFERFLLVLERTLKARLAEVAAVDLRYNNGMAVRWHQSETELNNVVADSGTTVQ